MNTESTDVAIIGAGISGLSAAHWLTKSGLEVIVLEQDDEVGGTMKSLRDEGFLIETGPNSALETTPLIQELVKDCGLENEFIYADPVSKNRYILRNGKLLPLPLSPPAFILSRLFSTKGKLRLLAEPFIGRAIKEESIAEFVIRRLGSEFLDYAIDPFVSGVYAGKPEALSVRAAFPKLYALEEKYGGLLKGMIRGRKERAARQEKAKDRAESFSFLNGMQVLPASIAKKLGDRVVLGAQVQRISSPGHLNTQRHAYEVEYVRDNQQKTLHAAAVVVAVPSYVAAELVRRLSSKGSNTLSSIPYAPVASIFLGFRREDVAHPLNGFGFLVPRKENRKILGCLWSSSTFPGRAPGQMVGVTAFAGGARQPHLVDLDERELTHLVTSELKNLMQINGNHVYLSIRRWKRAIPQYNKGHLQEMKELDAFETQHRGIVFCSNFRGGIAVGDCIASAHRIADRVQSLVNRQGALQQV